MGSSKLLVGTFVLVGVLGCSFGAPEPGPKLLSVTTEPIAYQSKVARDQKFVLRFYAETFSAAETEAFAAVRFGELVDSAGATVPTSATFSVSGDNEPVGFRVTIAPDRALSPGWHDLVLTSDVSGRQFKDTPGFQRRTDGRLFTRFHVESNAVLLSVTTCDSRKLTVQFSEAPLQSDGLVALQVIESGVARQCVVNSSVVVPSTMAYSFDCGALPSEFQLDVSGKSELGVELRPYGSGTQFPVVVTLRRASENSDCLEWFAWKQ